MKKWLKDLLAKKEARKQEIIAKSDASSDLGEVRSYAAELDILNGEIAELRSKIDSLPDDPAEGDLQARAQIQPSGQLNVLATYGIGQQAQQDQARTAEVDKYDTIEYRQAFMAYCQKGTPIPAEYRTDAFTAVADVTAVIPTTIMNEIVKEMKVRGQIFSRLRVTNIPGGVQIPILSLKPTASRITEATPSARQKLEANTYVTFNYYGLECKVATSLLTSVVTLPMFEAQIVPLITEAMITRVEYEVFNGDGTGEQLGILVDTRVVAGQKITLSAAEFSEWDSWKKKVFAKVPLSYRDYEIFMGAGTFDGHIDGMVDANGQPIGRTNYGITDGPTYRFGGKTVVEVEEDVIASYDNASTGDVVAVFVNLKNYCINSNMQMAMYRYLDHDTNQYVDKAILINDGKLVDAAGVIVVKKGA